MIVTLSARRPSVNIPSVLLQSRIDDAENFLSILESEVKLYPKQAKKLRQLLLAASAMCVSMLMVTQPTMAASIIVPAQPNIDPDLVNTLILLMLTCAGLGVLASVVGLMMAGVWKMFFGGKQADEWRQNIYRGLGQVLLAPVSVALIVGLALLLFSSLPAFHPLVRPIQAWFQIK